MREFKVLNVGIVNVIGRRKKYDFILKVFMFLFKYKFFLEIYLCYMYNFKCLFV